MNEGLLSSSSSVSHYKSDALLLRPLCACLYTDLDATLWSQIHFLRNLFLFPYSVVTSQLGSKKTWLQFRWPTLKCVPTHFCKLPNFQKRKYFFKGKRKGVEYQVKGKLFRLAWKKCMFTLFSSRSPSAFLKRYSLAVVFFQLVTKWLFGDFPWLKTRFQARTLCFIVL